MFTLEEMEKLVHAGISVVTPKTWKKMIQHTKNKVEDHFSEEEGLYGLMMEAFIIDVGNWSEESSSSSEVPVLKRTNVCLFVCSVFASSYKRQRMLKPLI